MDVGFCDMPKCKSHLLLTAGNGNALFAVWMAHSRLARVAEFVRPLHFSQWRQICSIVPLSLFTRVGVLPWRCDGKHGSEVSNGIHYYSPKRIFTDSAHLQHVEDDGCRKSCPLNHIYPIRELVQLKDAITLSYQMLDKGVLISRSKCIGVKRTILLLLLIKIWRISHRVWISQSAWRWPPLRLGLVLK